MALVAGKIKNYEWQTRFGFRLNPLKQMSQSDYYVIPDYSQLQPGIYHTAIAVMTENQEHTAAQLTTILSPQDPTPISRWLGPSNVTFMWSREPSFYDGFQPLPNATLTALGIDCQVSWQLPGGKSMLQTFSLQERRSNEQKVRELESEASLDSRTFILVNQIGHYIPRVGDHWLGVKTLNVDIGNEKLKVLQFEDLKLNLTNGTCELDQHMHPL